MITWKLWTTLPEVKLWEAVALVLEIEPTDLKPSKDRLLVERSRWPVFASHSFPSQQKETDFHKALSFAERAANVVGPIYLRTYLGSGMNKLIAPVSLAEVVAFFVGVDWPDIPAPLLALVPEVAEPGPIPAAPAQTAEIVTAVVTAAEPPPVNGDATPPPLTSPDIAHAFDGVNGHTAKQLSDWLSDPSKMLILARANKETAPTPSTWWPITFAEFLLKRGASEPSLRRAFLEQPNLKPWLSVWQEKHRERNAFGL